MEVNAQLRQLKTPQPHFMGGVSFYGGREREREGGGGGEGRGERGRERESEHLWEEGRKKRGLADAPVPSSSPARRKMQISARPASVRSAKR